MEYILYKDKKNQGPYTISQLKEMAKYNLIEPEDYVWTETWSEWRKISTISQINFSAYDQVAMTSKENKESYRLNYKPWEILLILFLIILGILLMKNYNIEPAAAKGILIVITLIICGISKLLKRYL